MYDVLSDDCRHDIANKNMGDIPGDAFFMLKDKYLSYACPKYCKSGLAKTFCRKNLNLFDCTNPESSGNLVVRKIEIEVLDDFGSYNLCNVLGGQDSCKYLCVGAGLSGRVGQESVEPGFLAAIHPNPFTNNKDVDYWAWNTAGKMRGGNWYSLDAKGEGVYWRNPKIVKSINADCQAKWLQQVVEQEGQDCFGSCRDFQGGLDESSQCYMNCFFDTALGKGSGSSLNPSGGLSRDVLIQAWAKGFTSDDMSQGGCPPCPPSGPCSEPRTGNVTSVMV